MGVVMYGDGAANQGQVRRRATARLCVGLRLERGAHSSVPTLHWRTPCGPDRSAELVELSRPALLLPQRCLSRSTLLRCGACLSSSSARTTTTVRAMRAALRCPIACFGLGAGASASACMGLEIRSSCWQQLGGLCAAPAVPTCQQPPAPTFRRHGHGRVARSQVAGFLLPRRLHARAEGGRHGRAGSEEGEQ